jgi:hypothetical protein
MRDKLKTQRNIKLTHCAINQTNMNAKTKHEKPVEFFPIRIKKAISETPGTIKHSSTIEEQISIGHSRNSRKQHYFQASRG